MKKNKRLTPFVGNHHAMSKCWTFKWMRSYRCWWGTISWEGENGKTLGTILTKKNKE